MVIWPSMESLQGQTQEQTQELSQQWGRVPFVILTINMAISNDHYVWQHSYCKI